MAKKQKTMEQWLKEYITTTKKLERMKDYSKDIKFCSGYLGAVHLYSGIRELAAELGVEVQTKERPSEDYPVELSFKYKVGNREWTVFQICGR